MTSQRILIIDDDAALLDAIPGTLECRLPHVVVDTCVSVTPVLEQIRAKDYHAIITDMYMPMMNGLALLGEIKKVRPLTPVLLMTGNDDNDLIQEAAQAGAYDFIKKPMNRDLFVLSVKRALEAHESRREGPTVSESLLCLEGLSPSLTVGRLRKLLAPCGRVRWVRFIVETHENDQPSAFGYVEFASASEAQHAKSRFDSTHVFGHEVHAFLSRDVMHRRAF